MVSFIKANRKMGKGMGGGGKPFKMVLAMRECGKMMYLTEEAFSYRKMVADTKDSLKIN